MSPSSRGAAVPGSQLGAEVVRHVGRAQPGRGIVRAPKRLAGDAEHPELPPELVAQVNLDNVNFVSNDDLKGVLEATDATPEQVDAAVALNEESRLGTLRLGLLILAGVSATAIVPASRAPCGERARTSGSSTCRDRFGAGQRGCQPPSSRTARPIRRLISRSCRVCAAVRRSSTSRWTRRTWPGVASWTFARPGSVRTASV